MTFAGRFSLPHATTVPLTRSARNHALVDIGPMPFG